MRGWLSCNKNAAAGAEETRVTLPRLTQGAAKVIGGVAPEPSHRRNGSALFGRARGCNPALLLLRILAPSATRAFIMW